MSHATATSFLSGLIIGQDVLGALPLFERALESGNTVPIIGAPGLTALYSAALSTYGIRPLPLDATQLTIAGLHTLASPAINAEESRVKAH